MSARAWWSPTSPAASPRASGWSSDYGVRRASAAGSGRGASRARARQRQSGAHAPHSKWEESP
jgi:hypothetical protein